VLAPRYWHTLPFRLMPRWIYRVINGR